MRGSPLLRALIAFLAILALAYPLARLTAEHQKPVAVQPAASDMQLGAVRLQLTFTAVPKAVRVLHLAKEIWSVPDPTPGIEKELQMEFPAEGVDLQFEVDWPAEPLAAMRVVLTDPEGATHEKSIWGKGSVVEVLTFP